MKLTKEILANALALTTGVFWFVCALFVWFFPDVSLTVTKWWMMGMDVEKMGQFNLDLGTFVLGGIISNPLD